MIGAATLAGGIVIGITGGIAAPLVGGALAGLGASFFATTAGLAVITSVFGAAGAGLTGASAACAEHGSHATPLTLRATHGRRVVALQGTRCRGASKASTSLSLSSSAAASA